MAKGKYRADENKSAANMSAWEQVKEGAESIASAFESRMEEHWAETEAQDTETAKETAKRDEADTLEYGGERAMALLETATKEQNQSNDVLNNGGSLKKLVESTYLTAESVVDGVHGMGIVYQGKLEAGLKKVEGMFGYSSVAPKQPDPTHPAETPVTGKPSPKYFGK